MNEPYIKLDNPHLQVNSYIRYLHTSFSKQQLRSYCWFSCQFQIKADSDNLLIFSQPDSLLILLYFPANLFLSLT